MRHGLCVALLLVAGCSEDFDRTENECGFPGNCCWEDLTCNAGYVCNPSTKLCEVPPEAGLADQGSEASPPDTGSPDTGPPDQGPGDTGPSESGTDAPPPDQSPGFDTGGSDLAPPDQGAPDQSLDS